MVRALTIKSSVKHIDVVNQLVVDLFVNLDMHKFLEMFGQVDANTSSTLSVRKRVKKSFMFMANNLL
jgi:hypothetical protein